MDKIKAYRVTLDFFDLNEDFETDEEVMSALDPEYGFVTIRKIVRKDVSNWTDDHPLNSSGPIGAAASEKHFKDAKVVFP